MRVLGWQTPMRREIKIASALYWAPGRQSVRPTGTMPSKSIYAGTRKMVNYACAG